MYGKDELFATIFFVGLFCLILGGGVFYFLNKGSIDRFFSNINKDKTTARDEIYQTGDVRVYRFQDKETTCYVADKQGKSTSIFCIK